MSEQNETKTEEESALDGVVQATLNTLKENRVLAAGLAAYFVTGTADAWITADAINSQLIGGDTSFEANPVIRTFMDHLGVECGLIAYKGMIGGALGLGAKKAEKLPKWDTRVKRAIDKIPVLKNRSRQFWASLPLYAVSAGQAAATLSWTYLKMFY